MTVPLVSADSLEFKIGEHTILSSVSFDIGEGDFVGVIGPNGAGKTTLLRLILGILQPTSGAIRLGNVPVSHLKPRERARACAYLSQDLETTFPYPVSDIVMMGRYPHLGRFRHETEYDVESVNRALDYVGMSGFADRYFSELSGGEQQLVLFAKVLAQESRILVLDEPTSNLDIRHQDGFFSMAEELAREGKAVIAAVHNLDVASRYCTRLLLLDDGKIAAEGPASEVIQSHYLDEVYRTRTIVTRSVSTGALKVDVLPRVVPEGTTRIHIIGGAGSAVNITRELFRLGYALSGGIAHERDTDSELWESLGVPHVQVGAFSAIDEDAVARAAGYVEEADVTLLCPFPIGPGNMGNLDLAGRARRLLIIGDATVSASERQFFTEEARPKFESLLKRAELTSYRELVESAGTTLATNA